MYNVSKESNRGFLRAAVDFLQEKVIKLEMEIAELKLKNKIADDIALGLSDQMHVLRQLFFNNKQEKMPNDGPEDGTGKKKRKDRKNLPHNQTPVPNAEGDNTEEIELEEEIVNHVLEEPENKLSNEKIDPTNINEASGAINNNLKCPCGDQACDLKAVPNWVEESPEYEIIKRKYILKRHRRQKYKGCLCGKIVTAPGPEKLVPGAEFSVQMGVEIAHDKFVNHMPLDRQSKDMKSSGLIVSPKTLFGITEHLHNLVEEIPAMIREEILSQKWAHIDESPMKFFNPKKASGFVWSLSNNFGAYYQFEPSRSGAVAKEMLKGFKGTVISDAHKGYDWLDDPKQTDMGHAYCWNKVRSYFFKARANYPVAVSIVKLIDELFDIEHEADTFENLKIIRNIKSREKLAEIEMAIDALEGKYLTNSLLGKAINYFNGRRERLKLFLENEYIPLSNNSAERAQRDPVMGRKNFTFFRSINGADIAMVFYTIFVSCKRIGVNSKTYLLVQALQSIRGKDLETPFQYALRLRNKVEEDLKMEMGSLENLEKEGPPLPKIN